MNEKILTEMNGIDNDLEQTIIFNATKNNLFKINDNMKILNRKLKSNYKVNVNRELVTEDNDIVNSGNVLILPGPRLLFGEQEIEFIQKFINSGKSVLVLAAEGGEINLNTNINQILEHYGIIINNDCVIRTQYSKYFLPKECFLNDGFSSSIFGYIDVNSNNWCYVYPFGATLAVAKPSVVALTSGNGCFPANRPICAVYFNRTTNSRLVVLGSGHMLTDKYIDQEQNDKFCEKLFQFLTDPLTNINDIDNDEFDVWDYHMVPDIPILAEKPQLCLVDSANVSTDFTKLFNTQLHSLNTDLVPEIIQAYDETNIKYESLTLIVPRFEEATPPLQLAVFPPLFSELPPPPLELFDLEEEFSGEETQLAQLTNRFLASTNSKQETRADLEQYVMEATDILGVGQPDYSPMQQVYECALIVSNFKMANANDLDQPMNEANFKKQIELMNASKNDWVKDNSNDQDSDLESLETSD